MTTTTEWAIDSEKRKEACLEILGRTPVGAGWRITLTDQEVTCSRAQQKLMWRWNTAIAKQTGHDKDRVHGESKWKILLPIRIAERPELFEPLYQFILKASSTRPEGYEARIELAYELVRSNNLSVKMMREYLDTYERKYLSNGLYLPRREDGIYEQAMGIKHNAASKAAGEIN